MCCPARVAVWRYRHGCDDRGASRITDMRIYIFILVDTILCEMPSQIGMYGEGSRPVTRRNVLSPQHEHGPVYVVFQTIR